MLSSVRSPVSIDKGWPWPEASGCGEKLCADRGRFEHENFLNAGDGCVGPDIGPGFGLVLGERISISKTGQ